MNTLQIVTQGLEENRAYYINWSLFTDLTTSDGIKHCEEILTDIMMRHTIDKVESYKFTDDGNEFFEIDYTFLDDFADYKPNMIELTSVKNRK